MMGQIGLAPAHALEGHMPVREVHGWPPDFSNPQTLGSIIWESKSIVLKASVHVNQA
jgi:hypothetical protein